MDKLIVETAETMSPWALFLQADIVVKAVMIGLLLASIWSWAIIVERSRRLKQIDGEAEAFEERFWKAKTLDELQATKGSHPTADLFRAGMDEWQASVEGRTNIDREGVRARLHTVMAASIDRSISDLSDRLNLLATIGSVAPFVGLFGTVWGIMHAFVGLGSVQQATLATVAPGIAEALIATAMGLLAAIPAVVAYNRFADQVWRLESRYDAFVEEFSTILQRSVPRSAAAELR